MEKQEVGMEKHGFSESSGERRYIAIYLNDSEHRDQVSGNKAKEIALDILQDGF